jgi:carbon starvation protein
VVANDHLDATLALLFMGVVLTMLVFGIRCCWKAYRNPAITAIEDVAPSSQHAPVTRCC